MDRNLCGPALCLWARSVALPTEGVDRNICCLESKDQVHVALPTEGVDRNRKPNMDYAKQNPSPSPRRAWIEMMSPSTVIAMTMSPSPRRAWIEIGWRCRWSGRRRSPSPRRAWIEIIPARRSIAARQVALPTEGVDRNNAKRLGLSPTAGSPSPRRAWIEIVEDAHLVLRGRVALPTEGVDRNRQRSG